jgi:PAS domain S-box-containing protein
MVNQHDDLPLLAPIGALTKPGIGSQQRLLELLTGGASLDDALDALARRIEAESASGRRACVLLLDANGRQLRHGAAPSLPAAVTAAIDCLASGPDAGARSMAAGPETAIIVTDIATDPRWADVKELAQAHGLRVCWSMPILLATGDVLGTVAMYADEPSSPSDDERKLLEFAARTAALLIERTRLDELRARLAAIVESSDDAIVSKDLNGVIRTWNAGAERLFGYTAAEAVGQPITIIIPPERLDEEPEILRRIRRGERVEHFDTVRRRKDGTAIDISLTISPIVDRRGTIVGASKIARDITDRRALERQKDAFIGIAAHELRTPVTGIKAYTQLLARRLRRAGDAASVDVLDKLDAQVDRLSGLISDLLDVTRIEGGALPFRAAPVDLSALLLEVIADVQRSSTQHLIVAEFDAPVTVIADRDRIGQVVTNLLTNAIKYSPHAEQIIVRSAPEGDTVTVSIQDFGIGIPKQDQPQIFDRFYRVTAAGREGFAGLGLGLYIASEFVKRHGGAIWVESEEGQGTTVAFSVPLGEPGAQPD